jgi:uncharacterized membrane protein YedE/YeeE
MEGFPGNALAGGLLVGLAALLLMAALGRIAGVSGILGGALVGGEGGRGWRLAFLAGLPLGALLSHAAGVEPTPGPLAAPFPLLLGAGLLVGLGTQIGNGCTSGHGVCGLARGSRRSLAATLVFMSVAAALVYARRHLLGAG